VSEMVQQDFAKINSEDLASQVEGRIRAAIIRDEISGGARLNQDQLAKQLGVSRSPVRLAIANLLTESLVERQANGGVFVQSLIYRDVEDAFVIRESIEQRAIIELLKNDPTDVGLVVEAFTRHNCEIGKYSMVQRMQADKEFHLSILEATGNPFLGLAVRPVWPVVERAMWRLLRMDRMHAIAWGEHEALVNALQENDLNSAIKFLSEHLNDALVRLKQVLK